MTETIEQANRIASIKSLKQMLKKRNCRRILVGMSGGLDSTYTAWALKELGYEVGGVYLRMFDGADASNAYQAAEQAGVALTVIDAEQTFDANVVRNFLDEYAAGRTPNPCVRCNRFVKVKLLCDVAAKGGYDHVATGHYADICQDESNGRWFARPADDRKKDQSYVLWGLTQTQLSMLLTPLFHMDKAYIRTQAAQMGFSSAAVKESQDICFIPDGDYVSFVERRLGAFRPGDFVDRDGCVVGRHRGIIRYTIGQRKGLGLAMNGHIFVTGIDSTANRVYVDREDGVFRTEMTVSDVNYQAQQPLHPGETLATMVKIRYAAPAVRAQVTALSDARIRVEFDAPARAVTPGQSAVFYDPATTNGGVLFGGLIETSDG